MPKRKTPENEAEQLADFKRTAKEVGADADKESDAVMKRLAQQKRKDGKLLKMEP